MTFHTLEFAFFLPLVFILYWFVTQGRLKLQNTLILVASYIFYGWWDWRFLGLIFVSSLVDYLVGLALLKENRSKRRKYLLALSIITNVGILGFFKYYDFFAQSFVDAFTFFGHSIEIRSLNLILPVGISFYTFQTLSYTIDVYRKKLEPCRDLIPFLGFVSFFPQLVAGPIERATHLLPQFFKQRVFDYKQAVLGMKQVLWGLFKKVVIGDTFALYVAHIFENHQINSGNTLFVGALFLVIYIYADFSGYSDIAIGLGRIFGFHLKQNFAFPLFSRNMSEFWARWHISLNSWFRDYVYIPLGGNRKGVFRRVLNVFVVFMLSALWHGAKWTYVTWGFLNFISFLPLVLFFNSTKRMHDYSTIVPNIPDLRTILKISSTFIFFGISLIFIFTTNPKEGFNIFFKIFSFSLLDFNFKQFILPGRTYIFGWHLLLAAFMLGIEWFNRDQNFGLVLVPKLKPIRWVLYILLFSGILFYGRYHNPSDYFYFQF